MIVDILELVQWPHNQVAKEAEVGNLAIPNRVVLSIDNLANTAYASTRPMLILKEDRALKSTSGHFTVQ